MALPTSTSALTRRQYASATADGELAEFCDDEPESEDVRRDAMIGPARRRGTRTISADLVASNHLRNSTP
jgi:hypothetical protein